MTLNIAELRRLEAEQIQEKVARHLCKLMDDEWGLGRKLYMDTAKEILDDIALPELLKALEEAREALEEAKPYVARYESDNFSNSALNTYTKIEAALRVLPPHGGVDVG